MKTLFPPSKILATKKKNGKKRTPEQKQRMREARLRYLATPEGREFMATAFDRKGKEAHNKGKRMSEEQKALLSASIKAQYQEGRKPYNKGKTRTPEERKKISEACKGKHKQTPEQKEAHKEAMRKWWAERKRGLELCTTASLQPTTIQIQSDGGVTLS